MEVVNKTRRWAALLILAGVLIHLPGLTWGFAYDDFGHQAVLRGYEHGSRLRPWNLYDFGSRPEPGTKIYELGPFPWWTDATFKIRFCRPITSLSIWLDWLLFGTWAPGYHLTSLGWFAAFLASCFSLFRRLGAGPKASLWALAFLALDDIHVMPVQWIANRNTLLASTFLIWMVLALDRVRANRSILAMASAGLFFLLACGSKESGIAGCALAGLYLLFFDRRSADETIPAGIRRVLRTPAFWGMTVLGVAYLAFYLGQGFGANSLSYVTPWASPVSYASRLLLLLPIAIMSLFFTVSSDSLFIIPWLTMPIAVIGTLAMALAGRVLFRAVRFTPLSAFAAGWMLLTLLPSAGVMYSDRLFVTASVGSALLIGLFLERVGPLRKLRSDRQYGPIALAALLLFFGLFGSLGSVPMRMSMLSTMVRFDRDVVVHADIDRSSPAPRQVLVLNAPSSLIALTMSATWGVTYDDIETGIFNLQFGGRPLGWSRIDDRTMLLRTDGRPFLTGPLERLFRANGETPAVGDRYKTAAFEAQIAEVDSDGVRAVRFTFDRPLEDASYQFLAWREADPDSPPTSTNENSAARRGGLVRIAPPTVGQTVRLPEVEPLYPMVP